MAAAVGSPLWRALHRAPTVPLVHSEGAGRHKRGGHMEVSQGDEVVPQATGILLQQRQHVVLKVFGGGCPAACRQAGGG